MNTFDSLLSQYGYWAVFGSILLEDFGLPLPGETLLIAGSVMASQGDMDIVPLLLLAWAGAVLGDNIGYGADSDDHGGVCGQNDRHHQLHWAGYRRRHPPGRGAEVRYTGNMRPAAR